MFENIVLMIMLVPKRDEVTREWGKLHNEELNDLYSSLNIVQVIKSRSMIWVGHVTRTRKRIGIYRFGGKRTFGITRHRWEDNIKMDPQEVG
jgi:hypothetical protein